MRDNWASSVEGVPKRRRRDTPPAPLLWNCDGPGMAEAGFDEWLEALCATYYSADRGRESIPPGVYFRMHIGRLLRGHRLSGQSVRFRGSCAHPQPSETPRRESDA